MTKKEEIKEEEKIENEIVSEEAEEVLNEYAENSEDEETEEQSIYDDADDEFMETVKPQTLSPEKAAERKKELIAENEELEEKIEVLECIEELNKHQGWEFLMESIKSTLHILVDKEDSSLIKSAKIIDGIKLVKELLSKHSSELYSKKSCLKRNKEEIECLKAIQPSLFDEEEKPVEVEA